MKSINNNLIIFKHQGYEVQLDPSNEVVLFHPGHPVCKTEFPELDSQDRVMLCAWDWLPEPVEERTRHLLMKVRSLPVLPRSGQARAFAITNPFAEPGFDYVKNWEEYPVDEKKKTRREKEVA